MERDDGVEGVVGVRFDSLFQVIVGVAALGALLARDLFGSAVVS